MKECLVGAKIEDIKKKNHKITLSYITSASFKEVKSFKLTQFMSLNVHSSSLELKLGQVKLEGEVVQSCVRRWEVVRRGTSGSRLYCSTSGCTG